MPLVSVASADYFTSQAIRAHAFAAPIELAEQAVHCLELVAELADAGLDFQFKGGNSLLLILDNPQRFSIDVDIATDENRESIEQSLNKIIGKYDVFTRWEKRPHVTKPWLPLASYYLYYPSHFTGPDMVNIMLDAQLKRSPYQTRRMPVCCGELYRSAINAEVPLTASLVGDKLLTLGPHTLGIPLGKKKEGQRLKHVFDVSRLLATNPELSLIRAAFFACIEHENKLQGKQITAADLLEDTLAFCKSVIPYEDKPDPDGISDPLLAEIAAGLEPFRNHLFSKQFSWRELQVEMARVALGITAVCVDKVTGAMFAQVLTGASGDAQSCWKVVDEWNKV